jgi:hypothetical protein
MEALAIILAAKSQQGTCPVGPAPCAGRAARTAAAEPEQTAPPGHRSRPAPPRLHGRALRRPGRPTGNPLTIAKNRRRRGRPLLGRAVDGMDDVFE